MRIASAQEICHFTKIEIPRNEARLMELVRVIEFRCDCILPKVLIEKSHKDTQFMNNTQFIAERYQDGKCVSRQCFSLGMYSKAQLFEGNYRGIISFGWHMDEQTLVGVNDTGYFHQTGFAQLPSFDSGRPNLWMFFEDSKPESRISKGGLHFDLYPIIAIRGSKPLIINGNIMSARLGSAFFSRPSDDLTNAFKRDPDTIIVYLSFGTGSPPLDYDKKEAE
ncbi:MAG: hypothetical protein ACSHX0_04400 [Akkermansiaceae bacterium]